MPNSDGTILPMEASSVKQIVAGQAITDLSSAVKELIDNAIDAGAKTINIRLFNQGLDILEVSDDGCGVAPESRPYIAMKHTTSKIRSFEDIYSSNCESLGFRGEALFCLANISSSLVVATRTVEQELAEKLEFTREGYLCQNKIEIARKVGTTVAVLKLFDALPVRRADLIKRIDSQRQKLFLMIQGYSIHCLGIKFSLIDIPNTGPEVLRLSTMHGTSRLEQTISSVLGSRFLSGMSRISIDLPIDNEEMWHVEGLIAKAPMLTARDGSVARNAQFFCINGRPVDLPYISRTISEAWRTLESSKTIKKRKKPACILHFHLPKNFYDINLSPDKRQVLLTDEGRIRELVHEGVLSIWTNQQQGKFFQNELEVVASKEIKAVVFSNHNSSSNLSVGRKVRRRMAFVNDFNSVKLQHDEGTSHLQGNTSHNSTNDRDLNTPSAITLSEKNSLDKSCIQKISTRTPFPMLDELTDKDRMLWSKTQERFQGKRISDQKQGIDILSSSIPQSHYLPVAPESCNDNNFDNNQITLQNPPKRDSKMELTGLAGQQHIQQKKKRLIQEKESDFNPEKETPSEMKKREVITMEDFGFRPIVKDSTPIKIKKEEKLSALMSPDSSLPSETQNFPLNGSNENATGALLDHDTTKRRMRKRRLSSAKDAREEKKMDNDKTMTDLNVKCPGEMKNENESEKVAVKWGAFSSTQAIIHKSCLARLQLRKLREKLKSSKLKHSEESVEPSKLRNNDEKDVPSEKIVNLSKEDFENMEIVGQFNLGFILAKCPNNNLWILDQHACDEKYNFEHLCKTMAIQEQPLIAPMSLELNPLEEACILDNLEVFAQNGFRFVHNPKEPMPGRRLSLTSLPNSGARDGCKAVQFGKDDIRTLCAILIGHDNGNDSEVDDVDYQNGGGTGVDGSGSRGNNAVRRYAGGVSSQLMPKTLKNGVHLLPKAIAMLANRACRNSIMIGKALSKREMKTVVQRMSGVEQPWNCPHGRPTMKHVKNMLPIVQADVRQSISRAIEPTNAMMPSMSQEIE
mmetsp:Transcript_7801/g.8944  ORF Transcript_7801/g.8944 Transcript_7801/m.8944 type:complete len:1029 (-) Transcript_7801:38-3124(-)|eukprot:CAMPEP_0194136466 /NCGR_PEP_ID=MMETSP0152-20130528/6473_1 /TAXON_ID=1049557 /ORGANISM="Thalassiothrix antarctica, Strain L6-D1" /LENGTH=1028 /DNA_ID=CAMNT_0038833133 /DNA_START=54 /DNA_END=3140 /DNA_ORIENTATION=-